MADCQLTLWYGNIPSSWGRGLYLLLFWVFPCHGPPELAQAVSGALVACMACFEMPSSHLLRVLKHGQGSLRDIPAVALPPTYDFCLKPLARMVAIRDNSRLDVLALFGLSRLGLGSW